MRFSLAVYLHSSVPGRRAVPEDRTRFTASNYCAKQLTLLFLCAVLTTLPVAAADAAATWQQCRKLGDQFMEAGKYTDAARAFSNAMTLARTQLASNGDWLGLHVASASAYIQNAQFTRAKTEFVQALEIERRLNSQGSLGYASLQASLALLPTETADKTQTAETPRRAIAMHEQNGDPPRIGPRARQFSQNSPRST